MSYVRCQRCERPVCPDCQRPAAVGVQCVDCVREQAAGQRQARTAFGGRAGDGRPLVTQLVIGACVLVFVLQRAGGDVVTNRLAFFPVLASTEPWRFVTGAFLHDPGFLLHIVFNMIVLWQIGPILEQRLGRLRFAALYLLSAIGGSVGYLVLADPAQPSWYTQVVGASGAVFGLFGALVVINRKMGLDSRGLVTGAAAAAVLAHAPRQNRSLLQLAGLGGVLVLLVALAVLKLTTAGPAVYPQSSPHPGDRLTPVSFSASAWPSRTRP
ncbi:MAG: rhomboid family intramembrane serine protease [Actinomycetota bacterium]